MSSDAGIDDASLNEWKNGPGKHMSIIRSSTAIVSLASSWLLVWILHNTDDRFSTTYHRLLLGMSVADIFLSFGFCTFGAVAPSELSYFIWNARGSLATCDAFGFLNTFGSISGVLYSCSLNLYYLAVIRYRRSDGYIKRKMEPWLHAVPTSFALIMSAVFLVLEALNSGDDGACSAAAAVYDPPHCMGYEDGEIPEGFEIPCGRGWNSRALLYISGLVTLFLAPIIVGISLYLIYQSVSKQEQKVARYGAGSLQNTTTADNNGQGCVSSLISNVKSRFKRGQMGEANPNQEATYSRAVMHRAVAYSGSYFITWTWAIVYIILELPGVWSASMPFQKWEVAYFYLWSIFQPLQGLWTFLIFLHPKVVGKRRSSGGNISWFKAFRISLWSAVTGKKTPVGSTEQTGAASGTGRTKVSTNAGTTLRGNSAHSANGKSVTAAIQDDAQYEEEKMEIQEEDHT